ncbi:hypothetical protein DSO57_1014744 [Entomophthora muscae]|uniref:Uncharacterized protein n=1 Tax=Entomophthora muscae TaxID=34485 RepID=A0ACC2SUE8_9FUNG|nr:hypothetical protein DSO57_1014744 [Entomophthora muscae]
MLPVRIPTNPSRFRDARNGKPNGDEVAELNFNQNKSSFKLNHQPKDRCTTPSETVKHRVETFPQELALRKGTLLQPSRAMVKPNRHSLTQPSNHTSDSQVPCF